VGRGVGAQVDSAALVPGRVDVRKAGPVVVVVVTVAVGGGGGERVPGPGHVEPGLGLVRRAHQGRDLGLRAGAQGAEDGHGGLEEDGEDGGLLAEGAVDGGHHDGGGDEEEEAEGDAEDDVVGQQDLVRDALGLVLRDEHARVAGVADGRGAVLQEPEDGKGLFVDCVELIGPREDLAGLGEVLEAAVGEVDRAVGGVVDGAGDEGAVDEVLDDEGGERVEGALARVGLVHAGVEVVVEHVELVEPGLEPQLGGRAVVGREKRALGHEAEPLQLRVRELQGDAALAVLLDGVEEAAQGVEEDDGDHQRRDVHDGDDEEDETEGAAQVLEARLHVPSPQGNAAAEGVRNGGAVARPAAPDGAAALLIVRARPSGGCCAGFGSLRAGL
jgi:hypothetical protein